MIESVPAKPCAKRCKGAGEGFRAIYDEMGYGIKGQPFQHGYRLCSEIGSRYAFSALLRSLFRRLFLQISRVLLLFRPIHPCGELYAFAQ